MPSNPPVPRSLILDLPLEDDVVDRSSYRHDGTRGGSAVFLEGGGLLCDGSPGCGVVVAQRPNLVLPPPWTVACVARIMPEHAGSLHSLVSLDIAAEWAAPFCQAWLAVDPYGRLTAAAGGDLQPAGATDVADGAWRHLAAVYTGRRLRVFVDGAIDADHAWRGEYVPTVQSLFIGQHPSTQESLVGAIAKVKVFRVALGAAAMAELAASELA